MPEAKRIAQGLAEVAEIDRRCSRGGAIEQWDDASLSRREALVADLVKLCQSHPMLAAESQELFGAMLERTRLIERQIRSERNQVAVELQAAESNLKQLGAFEARIPGDAKLLNRLA